MAVLIAGLALWIGAHLLKRIAPGLRATMTLRLGTGGARGVIALLLVVSIVLMVLGYRDAEYIGSYILPFWSLYVVHGLMFLAIVFLIMSFWGGTLKHYFRHPMLMAVAIWAVAHLLANGDLASLVLFGGMWIWAVLEILLINRAEPDWKPAPRGLLRDDLRLVIVALSVYAVMTGLHEMLGPSPFRS